MIDVSPAWVGRKTRKLRRPLSFSRQMTKGRRLVTLQQRGTGANKTRLQCLKARCKHCGHVKARNTMRQRQHLTECLEYLSATREATASDSIPPQADPDARDKSPIQQKTESPNLDFRRRRGRPSKGDKGALYGCHSLIDLQSHLKQLLDMTATFIPTLLEATFVLQAETRFLISPKTDGTAQERSEDGGPSVVERDENPVRPGAENTEMDAWQVLDTQDDEGKLQLQRAVARTIMGTVKEVDGFGYGPGNHWVSANDGHRFQFLCYDSTQNSNRGRRSFPTGGQKAAGQSGDETPHAGERTALPSFDCRGAVSVKFCRTASRIEVIYSHARIHRTLVSRKAFRAGPRNRVPRTLSSVQQDTHQTPPSTQTSPDMPVGGAIQVTSATSQSEYYTSGSPRGSHSQRASSNGYDQSAQHHHFESTVQPPEKVQHRDETQGSPSLIHGSSNQSGAIGDHLDASSSSKVDWPAKVVKQSTDGKGKKHPPGLKRSRTGCYTCRQRRTKASHLHASLRFRNYFSEPTLIDGSAMKPIQPIPSQSVEDSTSNTNHTDQPSQPIPTGNGWQYIPTNTEGQGDTVIKDTQALKPSEDQLSESSVAERLLRLLTQNNNA
ncbi:MAG: hypothetical protein M1836_005749 [Candelina mexicana]|nr:MAG: hypothetical protein M1836_005749 [Candelina mexicana]